MSRRRRRRKPEHRQQRHPIKQGIKIEDLLPPAFLAAEKAKIERNEALKRSSRRDPREIKRSEERSRRKEYLRRERRALEVSLRERKFREERGLPSLGGEAVPYDRHRLANYDECHRRRGLRSALFKTQRIGKGKGPARRNGRW